jgi:hypothetical protein
MSYSVKPALVFDMPQPTKALLSKKICIFDQFGDIEEYLKENGFTLDAYKFENCNCCIITRNRFFYEASAEQRNYLNDFVHNGGKLILIEPEFGVREKSMLEIAEGLTLDCEYRDDRDNGGYDSYVFADNENHPLWNNLFPHSLEMFNGAIGGEVVSRHTITISKPHTVLARCGMGLKIVAAAEIPYGKGKVFLLRFQLRGRLTRRRDISNLFGYRRDPVPMQLLLNALAL